MDGIIRTIGSSGEYRSSRQFMYGGDLGGYLFKINSNEVKVTVNNRDEVGYSVHCVEN